MSSIFNQLRKESPVANDADQFRVAAIDTEIDQCQAIMRDYARQLEQGKREMDEIKRHICSLQKERKRIARGQR